MKKVLLILCVAVLCLLTNIFTVKAQYSTCYVLTGIPYAPDTLTAPTNLNLMSDDGWSGVINIGFPFCFFGNTYSQCIIGANGCIGFNLANANTYNTWPISGPLPSPFPADL